MKIARIFRYGLLTHYFAIILFVIYTLIVPSARSLATNEIK